MAILGVAPHEAVAFEDSPNGVTAAKAAGLYCVAVPNPVTASLDLAHADLLRVPPDEAIAFEDSPNGVTAAKAAGLYCVAVPNPVTASLDLAHADLLLRSLEDVPLTELLRRVGQEQGSRR